MLIKVLTQLDSLAEKKFKTRHEKTNNEWFTVSHCVQQHCCGWEPSHRNQLAWGQTPAVEILWVSDLGQMDEVLCASMPSL